ncbi:uncharacterized protein BDW43DRAFT_17412 [Aspergillus alliaceus]|uniref:uncharacterized protein n=1 Tax=Petromyces alliaceus TaxID=209559 RepID=UPI0012A59C80|nr:uncharacterized protein BDW43DRAFT_17412 [Aspergillus alliaceus]KAB8236012.1 hypothetical protein BDW43DRAFT_17412 [Aspergillus alliaceus]
MSESFGTLIGGWKTERGSKARVTNRSMRDISRLYATLSMYLFVVVLEENSEKRSVLTWIQLFSIVSSLGANLYGVSGVWVDSLCTFQYEPISPKKENNLNRKKKRKEKKFFSHRREVNRATDMRPDLNLLKSLLNRHPPQNPSSSNPPLTKQ